MARPFGNEAGFLGCGPALIQSWHVIVNRGFTLLLGYLAKSRKSMQIFGDYNREISEPFREARVSFDSRQIPLKMRFVDCGVRENNFF